MIESKKKLIFHIDRAVEEYYVSFSFNMTLKVMTHHMTYSWRHKLGNFVWRHQASSVQILIVYAFTNVKYIPAYRLKHFVFSCIW